VNLHSVADYRRPAVNKPLLEFLFVHNTHTPLTLRARTAINDTKISDLPDNCKDSYGKSDERQRCRLFLILAASDSEASRYRSEIFAKYLELH
jgi:hypothetical protein